MNPPADPLEIRRAIEVLARTGSVVEVRALGVSVQNHSAPHTCSGYFENPDLLAAAAANITPHATGVYLTMNEVNPQLLARRENKIHVCKENILTKDADIIRRRWLLIDIDSVRPSGISSTDDEKEQAWKTAKEIEG